MSCDLITSTSTCHIIKVTADKVNLSSDPNIKEKFTWKEKIVFCLILRKSKNLSKLWLGFTVLLLLFICISLNEVKMINSYIAIGCTNHAKPGSGISFHAFPR